jgi:hypothetical protein
MEEVQLEFLNADIHSKPIRLKSFGGVCCCYLTYLYLNPCTSAMQSINIDTGNLWIKLSPVIDNSTKP